MEGILARGFKVLTVFKVVAMAGSTKMGWFATYEQ